MDTSIRRPLQGTTNIIAFNWHFYLTACIMLAVLAAAIDIIPTRLIGIVMGLCALIMFTMVMSLIVSYYVYDHSPLYDLPFLPGNLPLNTASLVNINAGFDEITPILKRKFPHAPVQVFDFYDAERHTEVSIKRARKKYGPFPGTIRVETSALPLPENSAEIILNMFSLHEIRNRAERITFLQVQASKLTPEGKCIIVEHLRDIPNFMAYNTGFFHFLPRSEWLSNFREAGLAIYSEQKITPFVRVFTLKRTA